MMAQSLQGYHKNDLYSFVVRSMGKCAECVVFVEAEAEAEDAGTCS
jgi:hypothetical protein